VAVTPEEIRFATNSNLGLFTVYFGPETGFMNGMPIPIFSFEGDQAFSGTTTSPMILTGSYPVSDVTYSDALNYDDEGSSGSPVTISASSQPPVPGPVPEPSSGSLPLTGLAVLYAGARTRKFAHL